MVLSVRHSGTHFVRHALRGSGYPKSVLRKPEKFDQAVPGDLLHAHFMRGRLQYIGKFLGEYKTVIPLRHPIAVAISWVKRGHLPIECFDEWRNMDRTVAPWDAFFFPLETKPFDEMEEYLGCKVIRHNRRLGSVGEYRGRNQWESGNLESIRKGKYREAYEWGMRIMDKNRIAQEFYS